MDGTADRERELTARQDVRPALHRPTGEISFRSLRDPLSKAQPASLCAYLVRHGVLAEVVEEGLTMPDVRLRGTPDLDRVQDLIDAWRDGAGLPDDAGT